MNIKKLKKSKNWFNTKHNQINIYDHYPNRKKINKITWRLFWITLIIFMLYLILLASLHPSEPISITQQPIIDRISPIESFILFLIVSTLILSLFIFAFTTDHNKNIKRFPLKTSKPLSKDLENDIIDTLSELLEK